MRRKSYRPYIFLGIFLFSLFYIPEILVQGMRNSASAVSRGFWRKSAYMRASFSPPSIPRKSKEEIKSLEVENLLLQKQNESLRRRLLSEERVENQINKIKEIISIDEKKNLSFYKRRKIAAEKQLELELLSLPAEVIYRDPSEWSSTLWVNIGEVENTKLHEKVVSVGSPVLKGPFLIGMIEFVGSHRSRVRLLTDASLIPSVRVARGGQENRELAILVKQVLHQVTLREEPRETLVALNNLLDRLQEDAPERFLAKGELMGSSSPLWRGRSEVLKGVGFNYDFADEEGPSLELRSGKPLDQLNNGNFTPLIDVGDLLVTTGMDGIFPKDIPVAQVTKIASLKEGSPSFDIEAQLCAGNLNNLLDVTVLPSLIDQEELQ
ncbi:MAG: rod shape-determining protein MreC [Candidatus Neptunochlamydia sp.]|nr:rod shape-determining protein MreC [Candidatus Neptunochlamydia sp.]